ncbi:hypothetical protein [Candidatus Uabimicrobium sp. HlEnr_7]|uniref:hypothetical protein n=1 Tax=Candidatus Uabimicrobium helgolandensis TaxID=3095367 RepID=UPI003558E4BB
MFRKFSIFLFVLLSFSLTGCLKQFYSLSFNSDLSGTYAVRTKIDLNQMSSFAYSYLSKMGKQQLRGATKEQFKTIFMARTQQFSMDEEKKNLEKALPEGVKIIEVKSQKQGEVMIIDMKFSFANIAALTSMNDMDISATEIAKKYSAQMGGKVPGGGMGGGSKGLEFKLDVEQKGDYVIFQQRAAENEQKYSRDQLQMVEGIMPGLTKALEESYTQLSIKTPKGFKVVKHNAPKTKKTKNFWKKRFLPNEEKPNEAVYLKIKKK